MSNPYLEYIIAESQVLSISEIWFYNMLRLVRLKYKFNF